MQTRFSAAIKQMGLGETLWIKVAYKYDYFQLREDGLVEFECKSWCPPDLLLQNLACQLLEEQVQIQIDSQIDSQVDKKIDIQQSSCIE